MADQQDATSDADVDTSAIEDDAHAEQLLADAVNGGDSDEDSAEHDNGGDDDKDEDKPLGPAGEKALAAEKERRRTAERQRRQAARELDEMRGELEKLRTAAEKKPASSKERPVDDAPDLDAIRKEAAEKAKAEVKAEVMKERVSDKIEVLAAKRVQDPDVVRTLLLAGSELADFLDGDKIDAEAIKEALDELLEKKPYLAVPAQSETRRFKGSGDGGAKPIKPTRPKSLGEAVSRKLSTP